MNQVERVARALCLELGRCGDTEAVERNRVEGQWFGYVTMANDVIKALGITTPSARITGDKGRENPAEGAPPHTPMGAAVIYAQKRIETLEADNALLRRALAYAQGQQLRLMDERTRYQVALIRIAEVDEGGLAEYTPQAMVAQARQALESRHG